MQLDQFGVGRTQAHGPRQRAFGADELVAGSLGCGECNGNRGGLRLLGVGLGEEPLTLVETPRGERSQRILEEIQEPAETLRRTACRHCTLTRNETQLMQRLSRVR